MRLWQTFLSHYSGDGRCDAIDGSLRHSRRGARDTRPRGHGGPVRVGGGLRRSHPERGQLHHRLRPDVERERTRLVGERHRDHAAGRDFLGVAEPQPRPVRRLEPLGQRRHPLRQPERRDEPSRRLHVQTRPGHSLLRDRPVRLLGHRRVRQRGHLDRVHHDRSYRRRFELLDIGRHAAHGRCVVRIPRPRRRRGSRFDVLRRDERAGRDRRRLGQLRRLVRVHAAGRLRRAPTPSATRSTTSTATTPTTARCTSRSAVRTRRQR